MEADFDFKCSVVAGISRAVTADYVHFVEALPSEEDRAGSVFAIEAAADATEGEFPWLLPSKVI